MLDRRSYAVKEHVAFLKLTDRYDIFDAETGEQLGLAVEEISGLMKALRLLVDKRLLSTTIEIRESEDGPAVISLHRKAFGIFRQTVEVRDGSGNLLGTFRSKVLSWGGGFYVFDAAGNQSAEVKGDWKGFNFRFLAADGTELGTVSKKWGGLMKEMFTSADSYRISLAESLPTQSALAALLLAAGLAVDIVFKERR